MTDKFTVTGRLVHKTDPGHSEDVDKPIELNDEDVADLLSAIQVAENEGGDFSQVKEKLLRRKLASMDFAEAEARKRGADV